MAVMLICLGGTLTAASAVEGQQLDYRIVQPVGHMQPWTVEEPQLDALDHQLLQPKPLRVAVKWRTKLFTPEESNEPTPAENKLPKPAPEPTQQSSNQPEVIANPPIASEFAGPTPPTSPQQTDCYQPAPLSAMSVSIALPSGKLPTDAAVHCAHVNSPTSDVRLIGGWANTEVHWAATCMRHQPLYFEEINAERYGYTPSLFFQPLFSAGRFFATIPALPYKMAVDRPCECVYTLGHYRPGSCVPRRANRLPWSFKAAAVETGVIAGMILIIP